MLAITGAVKFFGANDSRWGDVMEAVVGTGSVLLGVILFFFHAGFGVDLVSMDALRGRIIIRNDLGARVFARHKVRVMEQFACDPRMPDGVVFMHRNCAVRAKRNGWLNVGNSIKLCDMWKHGYFVLEEEGLVVDLFQARFCSCRKVGNIVHIFRECELTRDICTQFDGDEVFEGT